MRSSSRKRAVFAMMTLAGLAGCGGSRAMVDHPSAREQLEVLADGDRLVVRIDQPGGANVVVYDPVVEGDRIVLEAGLWSGGAPGESVQCFDIEGLGTRNVGWRNRDGTIDEVDVVRGVRAAELAAGCPQP